MIQNEEYIGVDEEKEICPDCLGSGTINKSKCPECNGTDIRKTIEKRIQEWEEGSPYQR